MNTATTKRYILNSENDMDYKDEGNPDVKRMRIYIWDSIEEKELNLPRYNSSQIPTISDLMALLHDFCQEMNDKHEDDLLYLNIVKDYTNE